MKAGNGTELWDSTTQRFNKTVLDDIMSKVFGGADPTTYIKNNGTTDWETFGKNVAGTTEASIKYWVVPASIINANVGNTTYGMVVKLGGMDWMVTSLTFDTSGNIIATLYLANAIGTTQFYSNSANTKGNNMYSRSILRNILLTNTTWSLFSSGSFASQYLVQPKNIQYQHTVSYYKRNGPLSNVCHPPNEALAALSSGWDPSVNYQPGDTYDGKRYDAWGEDYIWIPSLSECAADDLVATTSVWSLTSAQRQSSTNVWFRSGVFNTYNALHSIGSNAKYASLGVTGTAGVRPAIHLNLTAAGMNTGTGVNNPADITTIYDYTAQTVKSAYTAKPAEVDWYNATHFDNATNLSFTYYDDNGVVSSIKDAGTYWVKAEITSAWLNAVDAETTNEAAKYGWTAAQIDQAKPGRRPKFNGTADTSDSAHIETDQVRWFKYTIKPKELTVNKPSYNANTGQLTSPTFAISSELYADAPALATRITGTAADGTIVNQVNTVPTKRATLPYKAQAILVKSTMDTTDYDGGNYVIKDANDIYCNIAIGYKKLTIPTVSTATQTYTGSDLKFQLSGYNTTGTGTIWANIADLVLPTGVTLEGDDTNGWNLVAKTVGEYSITAKIKSANSYDWCWKDSSGAELYGDQTIKITVSRKILYFDFTSTSGSFTMQQGATVTFGTDITTEIGSDDVKITLQYCNVDTPTVLIDIPTGSLDASAIANSGTYKLIASIDDTKAADNKNYALSTDTTITTQEFVISSAGITLTSVDWQYRENGGAAVAVSGSGESSTNPYAVTYTGKQFVFSITQSAGDLHTAGVKIDTTYGTNGYMNSTQTDATTAAVAVSVRLIPYDESFAFYDDNGNLSANQYRDFTLYVKVDKASIDFTKLEWSGTELEYNGMNQTVEISSGLPAFLTPTYVNNVKWAIGDYVAAIGSLSITDNEAAKNYNVPSDLTTLPTHSWSIVKKKILVSWVDSEESVGDGHNVVFVPVFTDNSTGAVEYDYYPASEANPLLPDWDNKLSLTNVIGAFDGTNKKQYYVAARLRDTSTGERDFTSANCVFVDSNGNEVTQPYKMFEVGANKNPVKVSLKTDKVTYNGEPQPAEVDIDSVGFDTSNLIITYKMKDASGQFVPFDDVEGAPIYAGEYKVVVSVGMPQAETFAIAGQREFDYTVEKADLNFSGMKWVDILNDDAEYTEAYTYAVGVSHQLSYVGTPKFNDSEIEAGLTISFNRATGSNAGKYKVSVTFTTDEFFDTSWNVPEDFDFEWEILQYTPDLSNVKWNYNDEPFRFRIIDETPVKYSARLIGFPEDYATELASIISYGNDTGEYSDIGTHTTSFSINTEHELYGNYGELVLPAGLEPSIDWEIHPLKVEKAEQKQTKPFDVDGYTFEQITNLPEDFDEYFEVSVLDNLNQDVPQTAEGSWLFVSMGRYRIQIRFRNGMNKNSGGNFDNVKWSDNSRGAYQITLNIEKLVFVADGWINGEDVEKPTLDTDEEALNNIEKYFDYVLTRQDTGESVALNAILDYETYYYISLKLKDEFAGNVAIKYAGKEVSETEPYLFRTGLDPFADEPENFYEKPTELTIEYRHTGDEITFKFGDWFDEEVMEAIGAMKGTDVGEYPVMVGFKPGSLAAWGTEDDYDVSAITVTFVIYEDDTYGKFILKDTAKKNAFKFQYEDFSELEGDIKDYVYGTDNVVYMTKLTCEDTLADLLAQFKNEDIKVYDEAGTPILDVTTTLATGMILRLEDGGTVLNQLTISVLGDVDGDGDITTVDKAQLNAYSLGTLDLAGAKLLAGDIDDDGDITTVDKAQLNAYTLGSFDIYENLILKTATAQALSVEAEEDEAEEIVVTLALSEEVIVKSEEVRKEAKEVPESGEEPAKAEVLVDTKRLRVSF